ncbi:MAG: IPT/TIG domain-containing protein [Kofleriaceae bacterium]|jgi:hypothetical protein|nr:IPT/TIG domain-containing protein [Kofleriaceae bacterium]MBP6835864.1 IPT/TIG domain-containing protein [Kofleriaceae bacterium]MBP9202583.1 IPT/TIG domain-containing protein [Kofleriaceae bacterium]
MVQLSRTAASFTLAAVVAAQALAAAGCKDDKVLRVSAIEPRKGDFLGGQKVTVRGNRFQDDGYRSVKVYFGSTQAVVDKFIGDDEFVVTSPPGPKGETVDIKFYFEPGGVLVVPKAYTFVETQRAGVGDLGTKKK